MAIENIYERCHVMAKMKLPVKDTLKDQLKVPSLPRGPPTHSVATLRTNAASLRSAWVPTGRCSECRPVAATQ